MNQPLRNIQRIILSALAIVITAGLTGCGNGGTASTIHSDGRDHYHAGSRDRGSRLRRLYITVNGSNFVSGAIMSDNAILAAMRRVGIDKEETTGMAFER